MQDWLAENFLRICRVASLGSVVSLLGSIMMEGMLLDANHLFAKLGVGRSLVTREGD